MNADAIFEIKNQKVKFLGVSRICKNTGVGFRYPFTVSFTLIETNEKVVVTIPYEYWDEEKEEELIQTAINSLEILQLCECGKFSLRTKYYETNRNQKCEICFVKEIEEEMKQILKEVEEERNSDIEKALNEGFNYMVEALIHPPMGDDFEIFYFTIEKPSKKSIVSVLKRHHCEMCNDYVVTKIRKGKGKNG
jgi:hypothetical protein